MSHSKELLSLEEICLEKYSRMCIQALIATGLESDTGKFRPIKNQIEAEKEVEEAVKAVPGVLLEKVLGKVLKVLKKMSHEGGYSQIIQLLHKTLKLLLQDSVKQFYPFSVFDHPGPPFDLKYHEDVKYGIGKLKFVTHLNLGPFCTDEILYILASNSGSLKVFKTYSPEYTDSGLLALAGVATKEQLKPNGGCFRLQEIDICRSKILKISQMTIVALLKTLPHLLVLRCHNLVEAIETLTEVDPDFQQSGKKRLKLTHLEQKRDEIPFSGDEKISNILQRVCPNLVSLTFNLPENGFSQSLPFKNAKELFLRCDIPIFGLKINKMSDLVKLKIDFVILSLSHFISITKCCSQLEELQLHGIYLNEMDINISSKNPGVLKKLEVLEISLKGAGKFPIINIALSGYRQEPPPVDISQEVFKFIVIDACPNLRELNCRAYIDFDDNRFLLELMKAKAMPHVSSLTLYIFTEIDFLDSLDRVMKIKKVLLSNLPELKFLVLGNEYGYHNVLDENLPPVHYNHW